MKLGLGKKTMALFLAYLLAIIPFLVIGCSGGGAGGGRDSASTSAGNGSNSSISATATASPTNSQTPQSTSTPTSTGINPSNSQEAIQQNEQLRIRVEDLVNRYSQYIQLDNQGVYHFEFTGIIENIDPQELNQIRTMIDSANNNRIFRSGINSRQEAFLGQDGLYWLKIGDGLYIRTEWWGQRLYLMDSLVKKVKNILLYTGVGISAPGALCLMIGWEAAGLLIIAASSIFWLGYGGFSWYDNGNGVYYKYPWGFPTGYYTSAPRIVFAADGGGGSSSGGSSSSSGGSSSGGSSSSSSGGSLSSSGGSSSGGYYNPYAGSRDPEAFRRCNEQNGGGWIPFDNGGGIRVHRLLDAEVLDVRKDGMSGRGMIALVDGDSEAHMIYDEIMDQWNNPDKWGWPNTDEMPAGRSRYGTEGSCQIFQKGKAYKSRFGVKYLANDIARKHDEIENGTCGPFGYPVENVQTTGSSPHTGVVADYYQFEGGQIYLSRYGIIAIWGEDCQLYNEIMRPTGSNSDIGLITSNHQPAGISPQGTEGTYRTAENGKIYHSKYGTFYIYGDLMQMHDSMGGTNSLMGFIKSNPEKTSEGLFILCEGGRILKKPSGEIVIEYHHPANIGTGMSNKEMWIQIYDNAGGLRIAGPALNDPHLWGSCFIQNLGRGGQAGAGALIQGTTMTRPYWVHGSIWEFYVGTSGAVEKYGAPISDEYQWNGFIRQDFQFVSILYRNGECLILGLGNEILDIIGYGAPNKADWIQLFIQSGTKSVVGIPFDNGGGPYAHRWGPGYIQDFKDGSAGKGALMIGDRVGKVYWIHGSIAAAYFAKPGAPDTYGYLTSNEYSWNGFIRQDFETVYILYKNGNCTVCQK